MRNFTNYVGIIDSGVGGLTVLKGLQEKYPSCDFLYLADSAYCPYGTKPFEEIYSRVSALVVYLQKLGVCAVVLACNTASIFADRLRADFAFPIYDVIAPTCRLVAQSTFTKRVALLATNATVKSGMYSKHLAERGITVVSFPCSEFVPFVEQNAVDSLECEEAVHRALRELPKCNVDTVILGCTHFPVIKNKISPYLNGKKIIECCTDFQPSCLARKTSAKTVFLTTGVEKQANFAAQWYGKTNFEHCELSLQV